MLAKKFWTVAAIALTICSTQIVLGQTETVYASSMTNTSPPASVNRVVQDNAKIHAILAKPVTFDYDETPFIDIMDEIRAAHGINVLLDQSARDDSLSEDDLISFKANGLQFSSVLHAMLKEKNATFVVQDGMLRIISRDVANDVEYFNRKIINCKELLQKIEMAEQKNLNRITAVYSIGQAPAALRRGHGGGGFGGGGVFELLPGNQIGGLLNEGPQKTDEEKAKSMYLVQRGKTAEQHVIESIKSVVAPNSWDDTNGDGSIQFVGGCLIISQSDQVIRQIESLLQDLTNQIK